MGCLRGRGTGQGEGRRGRGSDGFTAEGELAAPRCQPGTQEHPGQTRWERHHVGQAQARSPPGPQLHPWGVVCHLWRGCSRRTEERTNGWTNGGRGRRETYKSSAIHKQLVFSFPFSLVKSLAAFSNKKPTPHRHRAQVWWAGGQEATDAASKLAPGAARPSHAGGEDRQTGVFGC